MQNHYLVKKLYENTSVTHLSFKENTFDIVLRIELLHHFEDNYFEKRLKEISHLVKPGGILIAPYVMFFSWKR